MGQTISVYIPDEEEFRAATDSFLETLKLMNETIKKIDDWLTQFHGALRIERGQKLFIETEYFDLEVMKFKHSVCFCINDKPATQNKCWERIESAQYIFKFLEKIKDPAFVQDVYLAINKA